MSLNSTTIPVESRWRLEFGYDDQGRRTQKMAQDGNGNIRALGSEDGTLSACLEQSPLGN